MSETAGDPPTSPRPRSAASQARNEAKHQAEVAAIMNAAYRLNDQGESRSSAIQDILTEAVLSRRAFYRHFRSKDDLLIAMYRADSQKVAVALRDAIDRASTVFEAVVAWIDHWLAITYDPGRMRHVRVLASRETTNTLGFRSVVMEAQELSISALADIFRRGREQGCFPDVQPEEDARAIHYAVIALLNSRVFLEYPTTLTQSRNHLFSLVSRVAGAQLR
jgi:AcrR family transcriptional regulator